MILSGEETLYLEPGQGLKGIRFILAGIPLINFANLLASSNLKRV